VQNHEDIINHVAIQSRSREDRVFLNLARADTISFHGTLTIEEAEALASDLAAAALAVRQTLYGKKQVEKAAQELVDRENKPWMLLTGGRDERGELVYVVSEYGPDWPAHAIAQVPVAEGEAMRDAHNASLGAA